MFKCKKRMLGQGTTCANAQGRAGDRGGSCLEAGGCEEVARHDGSQAGEVCVSLSQLG